MRQEYNSPSWLKNCTYVCDEVGRMQDGKIQNTKTLSMLVF